MHDREIAEQFDASAQALLVERAKLSRLAAQAKGFVSAERQELLNKAATLVDDCAGALEELCYDLED